MRRECREETENLCDLIHKIKVGNRDAFMAVVRMYQQKVFITAYSLLRDKEDALDVVQETFLRFYQKAGQFKEGNSFQGWLLQITKNLCVDYYRKNYKKRRELESPMSLDELRVSAPPDPALAPAAAMKDVISNSIDRLAGRQRMVFVLRHVNELQYREISETMKISVGTVKSLHFKAVQNLKKWLGPYWGMQS